MGQPSDSDKLPVPPQPEGFANPQMELFQTFLGRDGEINRLSNTIELWDAVPKYSISKQKQNRMRVNGFLKSARFTFCHRGERYEAVVRPARIDTDAGEIEMFPGEREEILEDVLRKLASEKGQGFYDQHGSGVVFTSKQICRLLDEHGHGIRYPQLVISLQILQGTNIRITRKDDNEAFFSSSIITALGAVSREDWRKDPTAKWYVRFNSLIEECLQARTYRQFDFARMMSHSSRIARWLYKRMAHLYLQASITDPYRISLSTIKRDSGMLNASVLRYDARSVEKALEEMKQHRVLLTIEEERRYGPRQALQDVLYILTPHPDFIRQIKTANKKMRMLLVQEGKYELPLQ